MRIYNVKKSFGRFALDVEKMDISKPKVYGIIGANGSGKSTLLQLLAGLITPDSGIVDTCGLTQKDITLVPQKPYIMRDSVLANLTYPLKIRSKEATSETIDFYLSLTGLKEIQHEYAPKLSSGEAGKLALIRALIFEPKIIFVDETFSNMDMEGQANIERHIVRGCCLCKENLPTAPTRKIIEKTTQFYCESRCSQKPPHKGSSSTTWVIVSHQMATIKRLCDYVFYMDSGKIAAEGNTEYIFNGADNPSLKRFLDFLG